MFDTCTCKLIPQHCNCNARIIVEMHGLSSYKRGCYMSKHTTVSSTKGLGKSPDNFTITIVQELCLNSAKRTGWEHRETTTSTPLLNLPSWVLLAFSQNNPAKADTGSKDSWRLMTGTLQWTVLQSGVSVWLASLSEDLSSKFQERRVLGKKRSTFDGRVNICAQMGEFFFGDHSTPEFCGAMEYGGFFPTNTRTHSLARVKR